jgi:hypothetical protein
MRCTTGGSAVISSAQSKFGSTSFSFDGSSTGQFYMGTGSSPSLTSVTDWTMEAWVRPASTGFVGEILSQRNGSDLGFWLFRVNSDRTVRVYAKKADSTVVTDVATTATLTANVWTHVAAVRNAGVVSIYINGSRATLATTANSTGVWPSPVGAWSLGNEDGGSGAFNGFIDEVRVTVGVARYTTASFTVQTAPYPDIGTANGKHRYWRIQGMLVGASGFQLSELQFTKDGNDVATPAYTASATPGVGALADLFDGSLSTRCSWTSAQVTAAFWIQADYGAGGARVIDSLRMGGYTASTTFPTSLTLQYSDDGVAWTTKDSTTTAAWPGNGVISASIGFPGTDTAPHRFWRVTAISGITSFLEISELQFCAGGISQVPALNWSHTPSAGSTSLTTPRDGNLTTYSEWTESVTEASGLWISLDMRQPVAVDGLKLGSNTAATYPTQVGLMFSDDNVTWNITHDYATLQPIIANNLSPNIPFITVNYSAPSNVDPYFANVKLLLQGLGSSVIDRSSVGRTITTSGSVGLSSTGNLKYNPYSFGCTGSDPIYSWAVTSDFNFGSQDFTIEFWCNLNTTGTWQALFSKNAGPGAPSGMVRLLLDPASSGSIFFSVSGVDYNIGTGGLLTAGVWRHVAVAKQGTVLRFFVNGVLVGTSTGVVATIPDYNPSVVRIGCQQDANTFDVSGSFDDYRVTVGVARYLAAFTPPAQTLPNNSPSTSTIASSILSNLVAYWEFEQNDATTTFLDSHSNNHLSVMTAGTPNSTSSVTTTTGAKVGRAFNHNGNTDRTAYIPRSNTRLDIANRDLTFGGWMQANTTSGSARWVMGRTGSSGSQYVMTLTIDSTTDRLDLIATTDGSTITRLTSAILPATGLHFVAATLDRINNVLRLRVTGAGGTCNVTTPFTGALYTAANTANFCIGDGLSGDSTFFSGNREPVNGLFDQCFFVNKALTDAEYAYLYNTGSGRSYASIVSDATPVLTSIPVEAIFAATNATFNIKLTQNRYWIVSAYVKSDVASATGRIGVETSTGADFVSGTFTTSSTSGTWSRVWCVLDLSASSQTLAHFVLANDLFSANNMWVSHVMVEECMSAPPAALTFPNINPATVLPSPYQYPGEGRLVADRLRTGTLLPGQTITIGTPTTADGGFEISAGATTGLDSIAYKVSGTERIRLGYLSSGVIGMRVKDSLGNTTLESVDPLALKTGAALYTTNIATITAALDLTATDVTTGLVKAKLYHIIVVNSASSVTITLPDASSYLGITYKIINKNSGNVVISRSGSTDTIYGTYANTVVSAATSLDVAVAAARYFELTAVEADTWMISG